MVDDSIIGSLDRFIYNEHFEELIESIECEMPLNLTEYFDTSSGIEEERKSGQAVRQEIKSGQESLETSDVVSLQRILIAWLEASKKNNKFF